MLQQLDIQNYAIIDSISIGFSDQLNIITGETGAGKSILMGALSLILGDRADSNVLLNREKKCVIEGTFKSGNKKSIMTFLQDNDLDTGKELVIRREIAVNGKSRAFINDTPVNLNQLKTLGALLVDLHQQFDTLELSSSDFQQEVLDALAGNAEKIRSSINRITMAAQKMQETEKIDGQFMAEIRKHIRRDNEVFGPMARFGEGATGDLTDVRTNPLVAAAFKNAKPKTLADVTQIYGNLFASLDGKASGLLQSYAKAKTATETKANHQKLLWEDGGLRRHSSA